MEEVYLRLSSFPSPILAAGLKPSRSVPIHLHPPEAYRYGEDHCPTGRSAFIFLPPQNTAVGPRPAVRRALIFPHPSLQPTKRLDQGPAVRRGCISLRKSSCQPSGRTMAQPYAGGLIPLPSIPSADIAAGLKPSSTEGVYLPPSSLPSPNLAAGLKPSRTDPIHHPPPEAQPYGVHSSSHISPIT